ncbi:hypothetical protein OF829_04335 [Sphingomonas sp. LB-2]|uniref:hypothetical protein n=1 Tax=Sphingomonas caeni TaxID=2984949 RepID=UPI00222E7A52|nr:hypothetical protein [Sphingomonas caeni]MCW3846455.1 hypothetical protein [Sphingomonas caeni]
MRSDYWDVTDEQVIEKTGQPIAYWAGILEAFGAGGRKSNESVELLQQQHGVPRYWARTLTTNYLKSVSA